MNLQISIGGKFMEFIIGGRRRRWIYAPSRLPPNFWVSQYRNSCLPCNCFSAI